MERLRDWRPRLWSYLDEARDTPFEYGTHDCCLHAANGVLAVTGKDYAAPWRGRYATLRGGLRHMRKAGFEGPLGFMEKTFLPCAVLQCRAGDIAAVPGEGAEAFGIVQGEVIACLRESGMIYLPLTAGLRAWRV